MVANFEGRDKIRKLIREQKRKKKMYVPVPLENTSTKDVTAEEEERVSSGSSKVSCIAPPFLIKDSRRKRKKYPSKRLRQKK